MEVKWDTNFLKTCNRTRQKTSVATAHNNHKTGPQPQNQKRFFEEVEQQSESKNKEKVRAVGIGSTRSTRTMLDARFCTGQELGSRCRVRPQRAARLARSLANNLTLTIVLVALIASFAIAASSSSWQPEYSRNQLLGRLVADRLANLNDRAIVNDLHERDVQNEIDDDDDEQFLRHLKQAAEYLDAKMAGEPHERQPVSVEFENMAAGPLSAPRYELLDNRENNNLNERYQYALPVGQSMPTGASLPLGQQPGSDFVDSAADDNQAESEPKANLINYLLMLDKDREMEHASAQQQQQQRQEEEPAKTIVSLGDIGEHLEASKRQKPRETTLLEDEQDNDQKSQSAASATTTSAGTYGKVAHTSGEQLVAAKQHQEPPTSIFGRLKANISYYLPFLSQINILRNSEQIGSHQAAIGTKQQPSEPLNKDTNGSKRNDIDKQHDDKDSRLQPAKQSVSVAKAINKDEQQTPQKANTLRVQVNVSKPIDEQSDLVDNDERKLTGNVRVSSTSKRVSVALADNERDLDEMVAAQQEQEDQQQQQQGARTISALRQSNLMLPLREELLVRGAPNEAASEQQDSLLGRYIYAPTQHYYLNALPTRPHATSEQQQELKSAYAFQKEPGSMLSFAHFIDQNNATKSAQSNDLYFLVMVGAFCVMAMAVVLAAGLFAYRVQQQRKASQDTDYPTYGVVGPNNMAGGGAGKSAGAAAFVNGYFGSPLTSGKSASAKHLPDLYGQAAAIDSGLEKSLSASINSAHKKNSSSTISSTRTSNNEATTGRSTNGNNLFASTAANQDAARMYHYQHQKQQMIVSDRSSAGRHTSASDLDSDEGDDDGSYTVYECPGLASAHEMEIKNPLFNDDHSP